MQNGEAMIQRELYLPINQSLLQRPRLDGLLEKSLGANFVALVAGTGYGKTHALASFVSRRDCDLIWLHLGKLDNMQEHFWHSLVEATRVELPNLASILETSGFPASTATFDSFLGQIANWAIPHEELLFVVDEAQILTNTSILKFFAQILRQNQGKFSLIFCSTSHAPVKQVEQMADINPLILQALDLRFTPRESQALMETHGVTLAEEELNELQAKTDGWPLAVYLIGTQLRFDPNAIGGTHWLDLSLVETVLEQAHFASYEPEFRHLLIKLSLLPFFRPATIEALAGPGADRFTALLADNMFVFYDHKLEIYFFQNMYQGFLQQRDFLIESGEKRQFYIDAAKWFSEAGYELETVDLYSKAGMYPKMLEVIAGFTTVEIPPPLAKYLLDHLESLPQRQIDAQPLAEYLKAVIHLNNMELETANLMLRNLADHLETNPAPEGQVSVLGEVYLTLGSLCLIQNADCFLTYFEKAARHLKEGSRMKKTRQMMIGNNDTFFLQHLVPGERRRMEEVFKDAQPHILQIYNGGGAGYDELFCAESAYYAGRFDEAVSHAFKAYDAAFRADQLDIQQNARAIDAKVALMRGDYNEMAVQVERIRDDVDERQVVGLYELRDTVLGWMYIKLGEPDKVPAWILDTARSEKTIALKDISRNHILYASYLIAKRDFKSLTHFLNPLETYYRNRGHWVSRLNVHIMLAIGYMKSGDNANAMDSLLSAYEMCHLNNIKTPFIEKGDLMCDMLDLAEESRLPVSDEWAAEIREGAARYTKSLRNILEQHWAASAKNACATPRLTRSEATIFNMCKQHQPMEKIAEYYGVSQDTIRRLCHNACARLGVNSIPGGIRVMHSQAASG